MVVTVGISLYSTRLILNALGETDFGVFNLIAGVISLLSFVNTAMATSTQRYFSFYQGKNDYGQLKTVFANSLLLHVIIGIFLVVGLEVSGIALFDSILNIPGGRLAESKVVYNMMSLTVFFTVISVPFNAALMAHENMLWVAIVTVIESLLRLGTALALHNYTGDKLILYGLLSAASTSIVFLLYAGYCLKYYNECSFRGWQNINKGIMRELCMFAGWNLFGVICGLGRNQGMAVILNMFYGANVNAAYGIANQVSAQVSFFSLTMLRAINPQIIKSEGANDRERMLRLSMMASKFCFFLLAVLVIPFVFEMQNILELWLDKVPAYTSLFCNLILIATLVNQLTIGLQTAVQAVGRIKVYQAIVGGTLILNIPFAYVLLKFNVPIFYVLLTYTIFELIACCFRLYFLKRIASLSIKLYFQRVITKEIFPVVLSIIACLIITKLFTTPYRFLFTISISGAVFLLSAYLLGLYKDEKDIIDRIINNIKGKIYDKLSLPI